MEEVWTGNRGRAFSVTIDHNGRWSRPAFNTWLGPTFEVALGYRPYGRAGKLAQLVAQATGGEIVCLVRADAPPDVVFGPPGHLPREAYDAPPDWLSEVMEGPFPRNTEEEAQYNTETGEWEPP